MECPEFYIYQYGDVWHVACTNGRWYEDISGTYNTLKEAKEAVGNMPYRVIEGRTTYELF